MDVGKRLEFSFQKDFYTYKEAHLQLNYNYKWFHITNSYVSLLWSPAAAQKHLYFVLEMFLSAVAEASVVQVDPCLCP